MRPLLSQSFFERIAVFSFRHHNRLLVGLMILIVPFFYFLKDLQIETDPLSLESLKGKEFKKYRDNIELFGDSEPLVVLLEYGAVETEVIDRFTLRLSQKFEGHASIGFVQAKIFDFQDFAHVSSLIRASLLNSPPTVLQEFSKIFTAVGLEKEISRTRANILSVEDPNLRDLFIEDVLNLRFMLQSFIQPRLKNLSFSSRSVYFESKGHESRLLFVYPRGSGGDIRFCLDLLREVNVMINTAKKETAGADRIRCSLTGKYAVTADTARLLKSDMIKINIISLALILLLLALVFRSVRVSLICFLPILTSLLVVLIIARFFFNPLKTLSIGFAAILLGMGIDISFHLLSRYMNLKSETDLPEQTIRKVMSECGPPITIGLLTTATAFCILIFARFTSLVQWGILTSLGLFIMLGLTLILFPSFVKWINPGEIKDTTMAKLGMLPGMISRFALRQPYQALGLAAVLAGLGLVLSLGLSFEMNSMNLLPRKIPSMQAADRLSKIFGTSFLFTSAITLEADDMSTAMKAQEHLDGFLKNLVEEKKIAGFYSPSLLLPYSEMTPGDKSFFDQVGQLVSQSREDFFRILEEKKFIISASLKRYYDLIESAFRQNNNKEVFESGSRLPSFESRLFRKSVGQTHLQTQIWPTANTTDYFSTTDLPHEISGLSSLSDIKIYYTDAQSLMQLITNMVSRDFLRLSLWGFLSVALILLLLLHRIRNVALSLLPLFGAIPVTLGFVVLFRISFSPLAIAIVAVVIGIGIDDAVHLITRHSSLEGKGIRLILKDIAAVLTLTTISTIAGFAALIFTSFPIFRSLGLIIGFGVFASWFFTFLVLPPLLKPQKRDKKQRQSERQCLME